MQGEEVIANGERQFTPGDYSVFEDLVEHYYKKVFIAAMALTRNEDDSRDLTQATFLGAYKSFGRFQGKSSFYTWLYRIFLNQYFKYLRTKKKHGVQSLEYEYEGEDEKFTKEIGDRKYEPAAIVSEQEKNRLIRDAVSALPEEMKLVVNMRYLEEMSCADISQALNCPLGTVKSRLFNARELLKERLKDYEL